MMKTFNIPEQNIGKLNKRINKLVKIANKLNISAPTVNILDTFFEKQSDGSKIKYHTVEICGESPKINGWAFAATVEVLKSGVLVNNIPGMAVPESYRSDSKHCEHCNTNRMRKDMYIIEKEGQFKRVGKSCLKDFVGHRDIELIASYYSYIFDIEADLNKSSGSYTERYYSVDEILAIAYNVTKDKGYKKSDCDDSTKSDVIYYFSKPKNKEAIADWYSFIQKYEITEETKEKVESIKEYIMSQPDGPYFTNLKVLINEENVSWKRFGVLASAPWSYVKNVENFEYEKKEEKVNEFYGSVGERVNVKLKVEKNFTIKTGFNEHFDIVLLRDEAGRSFVWKTSVYDKIQEKLNDFAEIKARVKDHNYYKGVKQTVITRLSVI